ncbi:hypothetical protein L228DRAFT_248161 [Xylona heveae TC161]|uniref:AB hydrolase-1 domain-containing protein n=1 Tax=Xylona heveae (strain CBS 132557 / TC161) TaxID=1328760 RepID=A0A165GQC8_XYLHT|nr:hypothetical protein L228DRAFT_248161 [Xylona heveae TC161]KZF22466.1 hypothetical protein L228DRAFT_248161 [Xylona heveae TC161]
MAAAVPDQPAAVPGPAAPPGVSPEQLRTRARDYIAREKFNRRFTLPATDSHDELTVTYAVAGKDRDSAPTILFIGGLYGGRFLATMADYISEKRGLRFVVADRPGMGGSTPVEPSQRLAVWLETVPALMRVLGAQHVVLGAHSCGVIYALNTVYSMPWILSPSDPRLYLFAPWVSPNHSGISYLSISSYMPSKVIGSFDSVVRFVASKIVPTVQFSSGISTAVSAPFAASSGHSGGTEGQNTRVSKHLRDDLCHEFRGVSAAEATAQSEVVMKALFSEDTSGANHESLLLLKKSVAGPWGACESYEDYPGKLDAKLREYFHGRQHSDVGAPVIPQAPQRLTLKVFWAETDLLIGKKGSAYFDACFKKFILEELGSGADNSVLLYESETISKTSHDTVIFPQYGALPEMIEDILRAK